MSCGSARPDDDDALQASLTFTRQVYPGRRTSTSSGWGPSIFRNRDDQQTFLGSPSQHRRLMRRGEALAPVASSPAQRAAAVKVAGACTGPLERVRGRPPMFIHGCFTYLLKCSDIASRVPHLISDDGRECFERISRKSATAEHDGFRKIVWEIIMFSEIRKTISSGIVPKWDRRFGNLSMTTVNERFPTFRSHF